MVGEGGESGGTETADGGGAGGNETRSGSSLGKFGLMEDGSGEATEHETEVARVRGEGHRVSNND